MHNLLLRQSTRNALIALGGALALLFCVAFLLGRASDAPNAVCIEQKEDLRLQREVILELENENIQLRIANLALRNKTLTLTENISRLSSSLAHYELRFPQVTSEEVPHPQSRVDLRDVFVGEREVLIKIPLAQEGIVAASNSMDPVLEENNIVLEVTPQSPAELYIGDIIIYQSGDSRVIHRIVDIGYDAEGWYAITKGDNNPLPDPAKVRFVQVLGVVIGIIY
ncbi:TPA: signal peptidase I [Candidatus Woesearchaeota archaeon]|nr:MAG: Peptidase S26B, signal peptidase [Candidatus Peribacteria bacterium GW2011_GWB1_54_5]HIH23643.1 signal peptidase I [Candidatus Woesearchaeota archaeon]